MSKQNTGLVDLLVFADAHESYTGEEEQSIYGELMEDFSEPDYILLHGGPDEREERQRFAAFEDVMAAVDNIPRLLTTPSYKKMVRDSDRVDESQFIYERIEPESTLEEVEELAERAGEGTVMTVTGDYHVPRTEKYLDREIEGDYLVAGAEFNPDESRYSEKWNSELIRSWVPQDLKDLGKKLL